MERGEKRGFHQMEETSAVDIYEFTEKEIQNLQKSAKEHPRFKGGITTVDLDTKLAALKASSFVVSLVSFSGEVVVSQACGAIIETDGHTNTVITSLNLARKPADAEALYVEQSLAEDLKIVIHAYDDKLYLGKVICYDFYYNLLIVEFQSAYSFRPASFLKIDDGSSANQGLLRRHSSTAKSGDNVVMVGRYYYEPYSYMASSGVLSLERFWPEKYDCTELLTVNCHFSRCCDGAPVISLSGEIIGMTFYHLGCDNPILPINVIDRWWCQFKSSGELRRLSYGFQAMNLYKINLTTLVKFLKSFPDISTGVILRKVFKEQCGEIAGFRVDDVIYKCDGQVVRSLFQLWDLMWDAFGKEVEFEVARFELKTPLKIKMMITQASLNELTRWPSYD